MIQISVINESTLLSDSAVSAILPALQTQWNRDLASVWSVEEVSLALVPKSTQPAPGSYWMVFLDNSDQAGALGYHDLTPEGLPLAKIFVETANEAGEPVNLVASHEMCEMAVDPYINCAFQDLSGYFWAGEVCDPVEAPQYAYQIDGVTVSDFVTPAYFGYEYASGPYDFKGYASGPFVVLPGGYAQVFVPRFGWIQITGDDASKGSRAYPHPGSRRERRRRGRANWRRSVLQR